MYTLMESLVSQREQTTQPSHIKVIIFINKNIKVRYFTKIKNK